LSRCVSIAEIVVLGFIVAGVVNKDAAARYMGGKAILANLPGAAIGVVTPLCGGLPTGLVGGRFRLWSELSDGHVVLHSLFPCQLS